MKNIQNVFAIIFLILLVNTHNSHAQANGMTATYTGTWQYDNNNERFIVKIWLDANDYRAHYKKIRINNNATIYNSRKQYGDGFVFPPVISGNLYNNILSGSLCDNTIANNPEDCRDGKFEMKMNQMVQGCQACVVKARWKVSSTGGLMVGTPPPFSVPLDIELTKVSNTITLD